MKIGRVNIGELIKKEVERQNKSHSAFAQSIGIQRQNVGTKVFNKKSIDTELLSEISEILNFNFFQYYKTNEICNKNNYNAVIIKEVKSQVKLQIGSEMVEKEFYIDFGEKKNNESYMIYP